MNQVEKKIISDQYLGEVQFKLLMRKRITHVLVICSSYDYFILEEDGRIDEQIFIEYAALNLRYPPQFIQVPTSKAAFKVLEEDKIDLVITMLSAVDMDSFVLAKKIKQQYPEKPIVILTPFSREVSIRLMKHDLSAIDYVFCWLGNADILLAIIKLIEDKMNADEDIHNIGVQSILLVEDSVRFYSSYLPLIYKIIFRQSLSFMQEGLNEHQRMLRMRGRPKILLATNYNQAEIIYQKYKNNLLGVITDMNYPRNGVKDPHAGLKLCKMVKEDDKHIPVLLQSSDTENREIAYSAEAGFIHKHSKALLHELTNFITEHFAFGDFVFKNPDDGSEIARASDIKTLQETLAWIPNKTLEYHVRRNHFSRWLNARAFFSIGAYFKRITEEDFINIDELKTFIIDTISNYRKRKGKGVIAKFYREKYDQYVVFSRIGDSTIGGKARGLAFIDSLIKKHNLQNKFKGVEISIPRTVVLSTDIFDEFIRQNNLYPTGLSELDDEQIIEKFVIAELPARLIDDLKAFLKVITNPVAIRSSSLLEDSHYQPFAGVYSTYMIPNSDPDFEVNLNQLCTAIKCVYASVYFKNTKTYMAVTSNLIDEEKMGIVIQEVCGSKYGDRFYPTFSGVARSMNFYPIHPEKSEEGIVNIALGLGRHIVSGQKSLRFSPKYPNRILQLSSAKMALQETQKQFSALDLNPESFKPKSDDGVNILQLSIKEAEKDNSIKHISSTYDYQNDILTDGIYAEGKKLITFANVLKYNIFPLSDIMKEILNMCQFEMNNPVEIEFAADLNVEQGKNFRFNLLQIRPIVFSDQDVDGDITHVNESETIIISNSALGNGTIKDVSDFIYIKPEKFNSANNQKIVPILEKINAEFVKNGKYYILIGPGRWGSSDHWLGVPVKWAQISAARIIIESNLDSYRIDPSQGTHFFQNLTSFSVGYFTVNHYIQDGFYDVEFLNAQKAEYEDEYIRHIKFSSPVLIKIDGKNNKGIIMKPQFSL